MTDVARRPGDPDGASRPPKPKKQEQEPASEEIVEVAPGILRMQLPIWMPGLGHVNTYGLLDDRGLAVVDPGLPGPQSWKALKTRLKSAGFKLRDIHTVVVTHSHPDHFGGAGRVAREANAELVTHRAFTTWSLDRKTRKQQARLSRREAEELERRRRRRRRERRRVARRAPDRRRGRRRRPRPRHRRPAPRRPDRRAAAPVRAVGRRDAVGRQQAPDAAVPAPGDDPRAAACCSRRPTRRVASVTASACDSPGASGSRCTRPGHTLDHLCLYDEEHGILLAGDHVLPSITPHVSGVGQRRRRAPQLHRHPRPRRRPPRRAARPSRARPSVRRRARTRRGHQAPPPGAHGPPRRGVGRDRPRQRAGALTRAVPAEALGRDGRERDVRPPRAPRRSRDGPSATARTAASSTRVAAPRA